MDEMKFSLQASVFVNGKEVQGNLNIDSKGFAFISKGKQLFSRSCDWKNVISNRAIEKKLRLQFLKVERIYYTLSFDNYVSDKIYIKSEDEYRYNEILKSIKEISVREAECKHQEELEGKEAERKHQAELARQKAVQEQMVIETENSVFNEDLPFVELENYFSRNSSYLRSINELLVGFFRELFLADDPYAFVEDNIDLYEKILSCIEDNHLSRYYSAALENIMSDVYDYELSYETVARFIFSVCEAIEATTSARTFEEYSDNRSGSHFEIYEYIDEELAQAKREERERRLALYQKQYNDILTFIKKQHLPVSVDYVMRNVSGANRNVFRDVVGNEEKVLNFYKEYIWFDNLSIGERDVSYIRDRIKRIIEDRKTHHISEMYDQLLISNQDFLRDNMISSAHRLFSIVRYLCKDFVSFERPYFAMNGSRILNAKEQIERFVYGKKQVKVKQILEYAENNYMQIPNIIDLINSLNGTHFFNDKYTLIQFYGFGINSTTAERLEVAIREEIETRKCVGICELTSYNKFPEISIPWNEWLVYSILLKWGRKYTVTTAGNTYKVAIPVVALKNYATSERLEEIAERCKDKTLGSAVDITNVDDVFEDILDDILDDLEF